MRKFVGMTQRTDDVTMIVAKDYCVKCSRLRSHACAPMMPADPACLLATYRDIRAASIRSAKLQLQQMPASGPRSSDRLPAHRNVSASS